MEFQERDGELLKAIYAYDGVLARRHLRLMFWPTTMTPRAMEKRLALLRTEGYIDWPSRELSRTKPVPEPIVWLNWKGVLWVANHFGLKVEEPKDDRESEMRSLQKRLRERGIRWLREPRYIQLYHDLSVIDFRMMVETAARERPTLLLEEWIPEGVFLSNMDVVSYKVKGKNGEAKRMERGVRPDGYFVIHDQRMQDEGLPPRYRFLLELDNATHTNWRFGAEKVAAGVAYLRSDSYRRRFGGGGRWLVLTTGERRQDNLMKQAEEHAGDFSNTFLFTTFEHLEGGNVLTSPIWRQIGTDGSISLFTDQQ